MKRKKIILNVQEENDKYTNQIRLEQIEIHRDRKRRQQRMGQETQETQEGKQLEMETYSYCVPSWERESEGIERDIVKRPRVF